MATVVGNKLYCRCCSSVIVVVLANFPLAAAASSVLLTGSPPATAVSGTVAVCVCVCVVRLPVTTFWLVVLLHPSVVAVSTD